MKEFINRIIDAKRMLVQSLCIILVYFVALMLYDQIYNLLKDIDVDFDNCISQNYTKSEYCSLISSLDFQNSPQYNYNGYVISVCCKRFCASFFDNVLTLTRKDSTIAKINGVDKPDILSEILPYNVVNNVTVTHDGDENARYKITETFKGDVISN